MKKITIAIDGFSSCGKSTMAKDLAKKIGYIYVDSGAMYRAVTLYCLRHGLFDEAGNVKQTDLQAAMPHIDITFKMNSQTGKPDTFLNGENVEKEIRSMAVSAKVSPVSAIGFVRSTLVELQQKMGQQKGIVMDGRDIGTTVFPDAELKIFVTATPEARAERRYKELLAKGENPAYEDILKNIQQRDFQDQNRAVSPLRKANDAIELDNSRMTIEEQNNWLLSRFEEAAHS